MAAGTCATQPSRNVLPMCLLDSQHIGLQEPVHRPDLPVLVDNSNDENDLGVNAPPSPASFTCIKRKGK
ncbi:hypothetical protein VTN96DRAFT_6678 [Rasamsonia emersonii]